jgi:hypothetical protein
MHGWKEIANYLHCGVRTAQRWETNLGMPVSAGVSPAQRGYADHSELGRLDRWRRNLFRELRSALAANVR